MIYNNKYKLFLLTFFITIIIYISFTNFYTKNKNKSIILNKYIFLNYNIYNIMNLTYFMVKDLKYEFSYKLNISKISYKIGFFNYNYNIIFPSDLSLYNDLHIYCIINLRNDDIRINSFAYIYNNNYFECIEFFNLNENIKLGFQIYQNIYKYTHLYFLKLKTNNFNNLNNNKEDLFNSLFIIKNNISLNNNGNSIKIDENYQFRQFFLKYPVFKLKRYILRNENKWNFENIFNQYFCSCKGRYCMNSSSIQKCKYLFYLYIVDNNRNIYNKTDYLFMDFILSSLSSDDVYPVFQRMAELNLPVHYMTQNLQIYNKYCNQNILCLTVIKVNNNNYIINGDYLENYLTLILKLKAVISNRGIGINFLSHNFFKKLEYVSYIGVGHGVSFFKYFLYEKDTSYGINNIDKILIPPSDKLISVVKHYGWKDENIIKLNLPRWEKYTKNLNNIISNNKDIIKNNSIFVMFTWRKIKRYQTISKYYFKNIINLLENQLLYNILKENNIILYFNIHHLLYKYIYKYKQKYKNNNYIYYIENIKISECLSKTDLVVSDFSSIIFDIMYRRKPFIIYVPDAYDPNIKYIYNYKYYQLIKYMKIGRIKFENKFFTLNQVINKIIYYIYNDFKLDPKLQKFYDSFHLNPDNSTNKFINYLTNLN